MAADHMKYSQSTVEKSNCSRSSFLGWLSSLQTIWQCTCSSTGV